MLRLSVPQTWATDSNASLSVTSEISGADFQDGGVARNFASNNLECEERRGVYGVAPSGSPKTQSRTFRYFDRKTSRSRA